MNHNLGGEKKSFGTYKGSGIERCRTCRSCSSCFNNLQPSDYRTPKISEFHSTSRPCARYGFPVVKPTGEHPWNIELGLCCLFVPHTFVTTYPQTSSRNTLPTAMRLRSSAQFRWMRLPTELRLMILEAITQQTCSDWAFAAAVCKEWQHFLEKRRFHRLRLKVPRLDNLERSAFVREVSSAISRSI